MEVIRVLLVDDHTIVRKGLRSLLAEEDDIRVVGEAEDGHDAIRKVAEEEVDVVIMDVGMPSLNGLEAVYQLKKENDRIRVLMLTMHENEEYIIEALRSGASGYLVKRSAPKELTAAIRAAYKGETYLDPSISAKVVNRLIRQTSGGKADLAKDDGLTPRERATIHLIAEGKSNKEIADIMKISLKTVKNHRSNLMEKLDLHNTAELTQYAIKKKILILDSI